MKKKRMEEEERRIRKEKRAALRERHRLKLLWEQIDAEVSKSATLDEYNSKMKVYDIRDAAADTDGIIVIGGFIGELIITFNCM